MDKWCENCGETVFKWWIGTGLELDLDSQSPLVVSVLKPNVWYIHFPNRFTNYWFYRIIQSGRWIITKSVPAVQQTIPSLGQWIPIPCAMVSRLEFAYFFHFGAHYLWNLSDKYWLVSTPQTKLNHTLAAPQAPGRGQLRASHMARPSRFDGSFVTRRAWSLKITASARVPIPKLKLCIESTSWVVDRRHHPIGFGQLIHDFISKWIGSNSLYMISFQMDLAK